MGNNNLLVFNNFGGKSSISWFYLFVRSHNRNQNQTFMMFANRTRSSVFRNVKEDFAVPCLPKSRYCWIVREEGLQVGWWLKIYTKVKVKTWIGCIARVCCKLHCRKWRKNIFCWGTSRSGPFDFNKPNLILKFNGNKSGQNSQKFKKYKMKEKGIMI